MDMLGIFERAIRQAYRDALGPAGDPQSDYYSSGLGVAEEGGEALEPRPEFHLELCGCGQQVYKRGPDATEPLCHFCNLAKGHDGGHAGCGCAWCIEDAPTLDPSTAADDSQTAAVEVTTAIDKFDEFIRCYVDQSLHGHFADNDDNAAEYVRRAIRAVVVTPTPKPADVPGKFEEWFK